MYNIMRYIYKGVFVLDVRVGDIIKLKKKHPCGSDTFSVLRIGMDFKIKCTLCDREVMTPRVKIEKSIKSIIRSDGE